ncbi:hypothetical protein DPMN_082339 [Dreissena polymorpha]|uniref:Uncharacterized protein n=1 Tax=Dreissena polymorpha TaxID=45954 RepID=A0A9D4BH76_DREPO|nr:hypothetical protein DPMN_082339 [Dreissena polymorpha]
MPIELNLLRRDLLKPEMRNEYAHVCTHSLPYTSQLFGDDVFKAAKEIKECSRLGFKLHYGTGRGSFRGRSGFRPIVRAGMSRGAFRGRCAYVPADGPWPKSSQRRGGVRRM